MRPDNFSSFNDASREISTRLSVVDKTPHFSTVAGVPSFPGALAYDSDLLSDQVTLLEVAYNGTNILWHLATITGGVYTSLMAWSILSTPATSLVQLSFSDNYLVISVSSTLYMYHFLGVGLGWEYVGVLGTHTGNVAPAIIGFDWGGGYYDSIGVVELEVNPAATGTYIGKITTNWYSLGDRSVIRSYAWDGRILLDSAAPSMVDAFGNWIYFSDMDNKRALCLNYNVTSFSNYNSCVPVSSNTVPVIPLDTIDDNTFFRLTGVTENFVTGVISRKNGYPMTVYMICDGVTRDDPEFSYSRDMFICSNLSTDAAEGMGKMVLTDAFMWYIGPGKAYRAINSHPDHYVNNGASLGGPTALSASFVSSGPSRVTASLPRAMESVTDLKSGSVVALEIQSNGAGYKQVGLFGIDTVSKGNRINGQDLKFDGTSLAVKKLADWESDNAFDYWSQSKVWTDAKDLTQFARSTGTWAEDVPSGALDLTELNTDGLMYTVERASNSCSVQANFMRKSGDFKVKFGLVVNYRKETMAEAAIRLNKDVTKTLVEDCGTSGIYVIHNEDTMKVEVWLVDSTLTVPWNKISETDCTTTRNVWMWLKADFREGMVTVYSANSYLLWNLLSTCPAFSSDPTAKPWNRDTYGRAGLYLLNITPHSASYDFMSDATVIPLDDNSTFPTSDVVLVDSEQIAYSSKSANVIVDGAAHTGLVGRYGKTIVHNDPASPTNLAFGQVTTLNAIKVLWDIPSNQYIFGVRLWLGKVGFPDDGVDIKIYHGPEATGSSAFGTEIASTTVSAKDITAAGGWVYAPFYDKIAVSHDASNPYHLVILREKKAAYVNATNYYLLGRGGTFTGGNYYTFNDDIEIPGAWWSLQSGGPRIDIIAAEDAPGAMGAVYVAHDTALSASADAYNNQALVCFAGSGVGTSLKITGYKHYTDTCVIYTEIKPGLTFDETSRFKIVPSLLITAARALPSAHSAGKVEIYRAAPLGLIGKAGYFSGELDKSLATMVDKLCRKAGVYGTVQDMAYPATVNLATNTLHFSRRNIILKTYLPGAIYYVDFYFRKSTNVSTDGIKLRFTASTVEYWNETGQISSHPGQFTMAYGGYYTWQTAMGGWLTISLWENFLSIWQTNRLICTFPLTATDAAKTGDKFTVDCASTSYAGDIQIVLPEACVRVDNYVFDMGKRGNALLDDLVSNKRFNYQDDQFGNLHFFRSRVDVNTNLTPYTKATDYEEISNDTGKSTRILLEGGEVIERFDPTEMATHGNLFHRENIMEINSLDDARFFADIITTDMKSRDTLVTLKGALNPAVEPNDRMWVQTPEGTKEIIVDEISHAYTFTEEEVVADMEIQGRLV